MCNLRGGANKPMLTMSSMWGVSEGMLNMLPLRGR